MNNAATVYCSDRIGAALEKTRYFQKEYKKKNAICFICIGSNTMLEKSSSAAASDFVRAVDINQTESTMYQINREIKKNNCHNRVFFFFCLFYEVNLRSAL